MSVLHRKPHGFEGVGVGPEVLDHDRPAPAKRHDIGDLDSRVRSATDAVQHVMPDDPVAGFDQADCLQFTGVPGGAELLEEPQDRIPAEVRSGLRPFVDRSHDDIRVVRIPKTFPIPPGPRLGPGSHDLHVFLRHRPRSIAQAQESA